VKEINKQQRTLLSLSLVLILLLTGCGSQALPPPLLETTPNGVTTTPEVEITPLPTRPAYSPGELVDYTVQDGDTLPALAIHFNTTEAEIRKANPILPDHLTTLPPGMPMKIPIYYLPLWGSSYQIIPNSQFVNGPAAVGFDTAAFIASQPGWLNGYVEYAYDDNRTSAQIIDYIASLYSVSPRMLLALIETQSGGLSKKELPASLASYPLRYIDSGHKGLYLQLVWAANQLNNGYYEWLDGSLKSFDFLDGRTERPDPWQNAATVSLRLFFSLLYPHEEALTLAGPTGYARVFSTLFGDPWQTPPVIPGSLEQPVLRLPFELGKIWAFTGGPHTGWGLGKPYAAIDFAPPSVKGGCISTDEWVTALADGEIIHTELGIAVLDTDGDHDARTGWVIFYLHLATRDKVAEGTVVKAGDPIGHPSCEGGTSTGTHVHIARLYNGQWMPAGGAVPYDLEGWIAKNGSAAYQGSLTRYDRTITASVSSDQTSHIQSQATNP
jgi:murein DD-endopeptidase MepM/ murein hydrolase activator NlpD